MKKSRLELRPWPLIALAYVLGPFVGLNAVWATSIIPAALRQGFNPDSVSLTWFLFMVFGGAACLIVELVIVTPTLKAFNQYQWPWLNGWSAALVGFLLGAFPWIVLSFLVVLERLISNETAAARAARVATGPAGQSGPSGPTLWEIDGGWGLVDWAQTFHGAVMMGTVGLIAAIVFRAVAVRTVRGGL